MSTDKAAAWFDFLAAIEVWNKADQQELRAKSALADAASKYAASRGGAAPRPQPTGVADDRGAKPFVVGFGRSKGKTLAECDTDDLRWLAGAYQRSIDDPTKARWLDANCAALDAVNAELETR